LLVNFKTKDKLLDKIIKKCEGKEYEGKNFVLWRMLDYGFIDEEFIIEK